MVSLFCYNSIRTRKYAVRAVPPKRRLRRMKRGGAGAVETGRRQALGTFRAPQEGLRSNFKSFCHCHVRAKFALLRFIFCLRQKIIHTPAFFLLLFCKISRSAHLLGYGDFSSRLHPSRRLAVATNFLRVRKFNSHLRNAKNIFFMCLSHIRMSLWKT